MLKIMEFAHGTYELELIEQMTKLTEDEEAQMKLLQRSFYNGLKYGFVSISCKLNSAAANSPKSDIHETLEWNEKGDRVRKIHQLRYDIAAPGSARPEQSPDNS